MDKINPFAEDKSICQNSPTGFCRNRGNLDACIREKGCVSNKHSERLFEEKIIKK